MAVTQSHFRFGIEEGTESSHGWHAAEDTNVSFNLGAQRFLLRFTLQCDATLQSNCAPEFRYSLNGGAYTQITTSSSVVKAVTTSVFADAANTTKRLSGTGTFEASSQGCTHDGISGGAQMDIVASGNAETECSLELVPASLAVGNTIDIRLTRDGNVALIYGVTPRITITAPPLVLLVTAPYVPA